MAWPQHLNRDFRDVEFRNFSQNGEDGILLYLFSLIGHGNRRAVELCAGDGIECNSANLIVHHDWDALLLDGNPELIAKGREFYSQHQETSRLGPTLAAEWITVENVNQILTKHGYDDAIDFLSLDMDGVDYWILEAIDLRPRVIVVEYNNRIPATECVTVPYQDAEVDTSSCYVMPVIVDDAELRDPLRAFMLEERKVQTSVLYPALHELSAYVDRASELPRSEFVGRAEVTLPLFPTLAEADQDRVLSALADGIQNLAGDGAVRPRLYSA